MNYDDDRPDALPMRPTSSCGGGCHGNSRSVRGLRGAISYFDDRPDALGDWRTNGVPSQTAVSPVLSRTQMPASYVDDRPDALDDWKTGVVPTYPPRSPLQQSYGGFYELDDVPKPSMQPERRGYAGYRGYEDDKPDAYQPPPTRMSEPRRVPAHHDDRPDALDTRMAQSVQRRIPQTSIQPAYDEYHEPDYVPKSHAFSGRQGNRSSVSYEDDKPDAWMPSRPSVASGNMQSPLYMDDRPDALPVDVQMQRMKSQQQRRVSLPFDDRPDALLSMQQSQHVLRLRDESPHAAAQYQTMVQNQTASYFTYSHCINGILPPDQRTGVQANPIPYYYDDPYLQTGAFYGRSVASLLTVPSSGGRPGGVFPNATAWSTGGPFIATVGHGDWPNGLYTASFGDYGKDWSDTVTRGLQHAGSQDLMARMEQLGIPIEQIVSVDDIRTFGNNPYPHLPFLMKFDCSLEQTLLADSPALPPLQRKTTEDCQRMNYQQQMKTRDISFYRCSPHKIVFKVSSNSLDSRTATIFVWPSTFFGHIPMVTERWAKNSYMLSGMPMIVLAHNDHSQYSPINCVPDVHNNNDCRRLRHVYLSLGQFQYNDFPNSARGDADRCKGPLFVAEGFYSKGGSSGGVHMLLHDIIFEQTKPKFLRNFAVSVQSSSPQSQQGGVGSYLPDEAIQFTPSGATPPRDVSFSSNEIIIQRNIGNLFGKERELSCPPGFAAAGVIGSTISSVGNAANTLAEKQSASFRLGNLGIVCMPYAPALFYPWSLDSAGVVASGSRDIAIHHSWPTGRWWVSELDFRASETNIVPLNVYMNEYLSTFDTHPRTYFCNGRLFNHRSFQQNLTMCPPGYYIQSIKFRISNMYSILEEVVMIQCRNWDGTHTFWKHTDIRSGKTMQPSSDPVLDCGRDSVLTKPIFRTPDH